jgi:hypothetical protein
MNIRRLLVAGAVAVVLGFPLALGVQRITAPCGEVRFEAPPGQVAPPNIPYCMNVDPWTGRTFPDRPRVPPNDPLGTSRQPTLYVLWPATTILVGILLIGVGRLRTGGRDEGLVHHGRAAVQSRP